jgi:alkyl hydroperoxide reductase subunit AhpF
MRVGLFRADEQQAVRDLFAGLAHEIELVLVRGPEETPLPGARDIDFAAETEKLLHGLAELSPLVSARVTDSAELVVERHPAVAVLADGEDTGIRYYGLPWGYELASLVGAVIEAGKAETSLSEESLLVLDRLERDVSIEVFVTPT